MYQYTECRISYQLVTFIHFQSRIFAAAKKINIVFMKDSIDFGNMEIPRLFRKLLIPTVLGMVFSAVFVITDGIFVGKGIGSDALAAVNITAPLFMITTGIGLMFGVGASVVASIHLSQGKRKVASINITQALAFFGLTYSSAIGTLLLFRRAYRPITRQLGTVVASGGGVYELVRTFPRILPAPKRRHVLHPPGRIAQLCHDVQRRIGHYQYHTRLCLHFPIGLGNDGSCFCHQLGHYGRRI